MKTKLLIAPCLHKAAKFSVINWHYSKKMPVGKLSLFGAWEDDKFVGAIVFGRGATSQIGKPFNLSQVEICELVRVAFKRHKVEITRCVSIALKLLKKNSPSMRLVVSYADPKHGHDGAIYRAGNWIYLGKTASTTMYFNGSRWLHARELTSGSWAKKRWTKEEIERMPKRELEGKHKYAMPLDSAMRAIVEPMAVDFPKTAQEKEPATAQ